MNDSFQRFYVEYYSLILSVAFQRLGNREEAEDVTSRVFLIAWEHYVDTNDVALPWVYQTLRNLVANEYRRAARSAAYEEALRHEFGAVAAPDDSREDVLIVRDSLRLLPEQDQELLMLIFWHDCSRSEAAAILGCSVGALRVRLFRAKQRLRTVLGEIEEEGKGE